MARQEAIRAEERKEEIKRLKNVLKLKNPPESESESELSHVQAAELLGVDPFRWEDQMREYPRTYRLPAQMYENGLSVMYQLRDLQNFVRYLLDENLESYREHGEALMKAIGKNRTMRGGVRNRIAYGVRKIGLGH